jgi:hypothetical protein
MLFYINYNKKEIYITSPKVGTTTISNYLKVNLHEKYEIKDYINNINYKKIIIFRECVIERFLSGFYEDLFNNTCYNNCNISFENYLDFLYKCFENKTKNCNNLNMCSNINYEIWWGNCSGKKLNLTNDNGIFISHIQSQKYAINHLINLIDDKNMNNTFLLNLKDLSSYLNSNNISNKKNYLTLNNYQDINKISLSTLKNERIIVKKNYLKNKELNKILKIYNEDILFIENLKKKFKYII